MKKTDFLYILKNSINPLKLYDVIGYDINNIVDPINNIIDLIANCKNREEIRIIFAKHLNFNDFKILNYFHTNDFTELDLLYKYRKDFLFSDECIYLYKKFYNIYRTINFDNFFIKYLSLINDNVDYNYDFNYIFKRNYDIVYQGYFNPIKILMNNSNLLNEILLKYMYIYFIDNLQLKLDSDEYIKFINIIKDKSYFNSFKELSDEQLKDHIISQMRFFKNDITNLDKIKKLYLEIFPNRINLINKYFDIFKTTLKIVGKINL